MQSVGWLSHSLMQAIHHKARQHAVFHWVLHRGVNTPRRGYTNRIFWQLSELVDTL